MDLEQYKEFYMGKLTTEEELERELNNFTSANLVGEKAVSVALRKNLIEKENIQSIKGFPYIQIYRI